MNRKKNRFTAVLLALLLLILVPASAPAATSGSAISLEQAIQTVKQNFSIPVEFSKLTSGFNSNANDQSWSLNWSDPQGKNGSFSAQVDAKNGEIISMYSWKPDNEQAVKVPMVSVNEARQKGNTLLKQLVPSRAASLQLIPDKQLIPLSSYGSLIYTVRWQRVINNIPVENDGAYMEINLANGEITGYNLNWSNLPVPDSSGVISAEKARQSFVNNKMLKMQYMQPSVAVPLKSNSEQQPILVYGIMHPSNGIIDAKSGTPLVLDNRHRIEGGMGASDRASNQSKMASPAPLTPEETKEIKQIANLLTQDQAAAAAAKYLDIPASLTLKSSTLEVDWQNPDVRMWNLNWDSSSGSSSPSSLYARVNASTGELYSFYLNRPSTDKKSAALTPNEARQVADTFLRKVHPQRFQQVIYDELNERMEQNAGDFRLSYQRVVNGIPCPFNGMDISIDRTSKEVCSFNLNWSAKTFPTTANTMSIDKANEIFLNGAPLTLTYSLVYSSDSGPSEMRLVYKPQTPPGQPQSNIVDAHNGNWLDYKGEPVKDEAQANHFTDIAGHFGEEEIKLLGQAGLFTEYGKEFHPDENITLISMLRAMLGTREGNQAAYNLTDEQMMERAVELHWLPDTKTPPVTIVTRDLLARLMVRYLDIEFLTKYPSDMYRLPFKDADSLPNDLKSYAALTRGTGLIVGDGINFDPAHKVTRAEAAVGLVRLLKVK